MVRPLAERLRADGVKVWFDEWVLKPGDSIESPQSKTAKIEEGLELFSFGFRVSRALSNPLFRTDQTPKSSSLTPNSASLMPNLQRFTPD